MTGARLLDVEGLRVAFRTPAGEVTPVDGVDLHVDRGETLAVVGESGSGKSVTALSILRLVEHGGGRIAGGTIRLHRAGQASLDLSAAGEGALRAIRGNDISMIFQEPMTSLNPVFTVGDQIAEAILLHRAVSRHEALDRAEALLALVGIPDPHLRLGAYPHQLSGGMRQRVMIAIALACEPSLLIADEPTTALDVTIQAQILDLIRDLQQETGMAVLFITHDLGVVAEIADRVAVMYAGRVVEEAPAAALFDAPGHPYTAALLRSVPRVGLSIREARLEALPGRVPPPGEMPPGCAFAPRCAMAEARCGDAPPLRPTAAGRATRCLRSAEIGERGMA